jgi:hypothetical protein
LTVQLLDPTRNEYDYYAIVLELAPLDAVPHAIHLFLEQVDHGLWDHTYFYLNTPHVIQAGPQVLEEEETLNGNEEYQRKSVLPFSEPGLDMLAFPDYSEAFPHSQWTVGFAGRPGGPDFYINKVNNTQDHGPGGQWQHALHEQGDSCFAKVIKGQDCLELMYAMPMRSDNYEEDEWAGFFKEAVEIVSGIVLTPKPEPASVEMHMFDHDAIPVPKKDDASTKNNMSFEDHVIHHASGNSNDRNNNNNNINMDSLVKPDTSMQEPPEDAVFQQEEEIQQQQQQQ